MDHGMRLGRLRRLMMEAGRDHLLVTLPANVAWLTGCEAHGGWVLIGPDRARLLLDGRSTRAWRERMPPGFELAATGPEGPHANVRRHLGRARGRLAFEPGGLDWWHATALAREIGDGWLLEPAGGDVEALRHFKDADEMGVLDRLAGLTRRIRKRLLEEALTGLPLAQLREHALGLIADVGSTPAFEPLVAGGLGTLDPHPRSALPGERAQGLVMVDLGLTHLGLHSDVAGTVLLAGQDGRRSRALGGLLEVAEEAWHMAMAHVGPGVPAAMVARAAHQVLRRAGLEGRHDVGHGIGWQVHEAPWIAEDSPDVLEEHMVICLEPGAYHPALGGARREEMVRVTAQGAELLGAVAGDARPLV